jgi:hypothetical protein
MPLLSGLHYKVVPSEIHCYPLALFYNLTFHDVIFASLPSPLPVSSSSLSTSPPPFFILFSPYHPPLWDQTLMALWYDAHLCPPESSFIFIGSLKTPSHYYIYWLPSRWAPRQLSWAPFNHKVMQVKYIATLWPYSTTWPLRDMIFASLPSPSPPLKLHISSNIPSSSLLYALLVASSTTMRPTTNGFKI